MTTSDLGGAVPGQVVARATPDWLLTPAARPQLCGCSGVRRRRSFVDQTLVGVSGLLRQVMFSDDTASLGGLLQRLDPRVKVGSLLLLLVAIGLVHHLPVLLVGYLLTVFGAWLGRIPLAFFIKRVWLFVPVFTGIVVLPATLSIVTAGRVVVPLWQWNGQAQGLTDTGLTSASLVTTRVATSVSLVLLLTLTTSWTNLLAGLRALGLPRVFILVIGMAYRYIFLLLSTVGEMYESRKARTLLVNRRAAQNRHFLASSAGALFSKTSYLAEEVHQAMVARGWRGNPRTLQPFKLRIRDLIAAVAALLVAATIYGGDLYLGR